MKIAFSCPLTLGKIGSGVPYGHVMKAVELDGGKQVPVPEGLRQAFQEGSLEYATFYDLYASEEFDFDDYDAYLGVGGASLLQMYNCHHAQSATLWFSSHFDFAFPMIIQEYMNLGIQVQRPPQDPFMRWKCEREQRQSDIIIVPSSICAGTYNLRDYCQGKVHVANFGVDSQKFHPAKHENEQLVFLTAATNPIRKGMPYLFQAWEWLMADYGRKALLRFIGFKLPGKERRPYTDELGWVNDDRVPRVMRDADVFVHPSLEEGQALACLEAMASGLPVIATPESAAPIGNRMREEVTPNRTLEIYENGILVPPRDSAALKVAMQWMVENPEVRKAMGETARKTVEQYTWERFGKRVIEIMEGAV